MILSTSSADGTRSIGARVARGAVAGDVYCLDGDLGTGKTEFVRGFVYELDKKNGVRSPSFSIVNTYPTPRFTVYHFDFYRLCDVSELDNIGFHEYITGNGVCLIEWATLFPSVLPLNSRRIVLRDIGGCSRELDLNFEI